MSGCTNQTPALTQAHRFDLASLAKKPMFAAAACIVLANRRTNEFLDNETIAKAEATAGRAVLEAIAAFPLDPKVPAFALRSTHPVAGDHEQRLVRVAPGVQAAHHGISDGVRCVLAQLAVKGAGERDL